MGRDQIKFEKYNYYATNLSMILFSKYDIQNEIKIKLNQVLQWKYYTLSNNLII